MPEEVLPIGLYVCAAKESGYHGTVVVFRNSTEERGGNGLFRMPTADADKFELNTVYRLSAVKTNEPLPARMRRR